MNRFALCAALALLPVPAFADVIHCELPWFARNLIFDRAGYCFGSTLGRATFDNADCTRTEVTLSERDRAAVDHILDLEEALSCAIDSSAPRLEHLSHIEHLRNADMVPAPVEHESGCIGYRGPVLPLRAAPGDQARVIGELRPGDTVGFIFLNEGIWDCVLVNDPDDMSTLRDAGWAPFGLGHIECEMYAG
jgi:hypothetical protein